MEAFIGIFGTILGFALSEIATRLREAQQDRKRAVAVRAILRLEMGLNLRLLQAVWARVNPDGKTADSESTKRYYAQTLVSAPLILFSREAFSSQMPLLSNALTEAQIVKVFEFYERLNQLTVIHSQIAAWLNEQTASAQAAGLPVPGKPPAITSRVFNEHAPDAWDEYDRIVRQLLDAGNPLDHAA